MARLAQSRFFDSDVLTKYLENQPEADVIEPLINEAVSGLWLIVVSAVTLLEVTRPPGRYDPTKHALVSQFFDNEYIYVRDVDAQLANRACDLIYDYNWLHPMDAIHLAAAIDVGCQAFYTYEIELRRRFDKEHGLRVLEPGTPLPVPLTDTRGLPLFEPPDS